MMGVTNYIPKKVGVGTGRHVPVGGGVVRQEATHFSASHKTLQTIQVAQEPPRWRRVHESSDRFCPFNVIQSLTGHCAHSKGPQRIILKRSRTRGCCSRDKRKRVARRW